MKNEIQISVNSDLSCKNISLAVQWDKRDFLHQSRAAKSIISLRFIYMRLYNDLYSHMTKMVARQ